MYRKLILLMAIILMPSICFAQRTSVVIRAATNSTVLEAGGTNVTISKSIQLKTKLADTLGVFFKADDEAATDLSIDFQQSFRPPKTEGTFDPTYITTDTVNTSVTDNEWHIATLSTVVANYGRFVITGQGSNYVGNTIQIRITK